MSLPQNSRYRDLFHNLPDEFLEDIVLLRRIRSGGDIYGQPAYTITENLMRGRFEVLDAVDRVPEQGGLREITQARIFLPLPEYKEGLVDYFEYGSPGSPAIPDPTKWIILSGTPSVNGHQLIVKYDTPTIDELDAISSFNIIYGKVEFEIDLSTPPYLGFFALLDTDAGDPFADYIRVVYDYTTSWAFKFYSKAGGVSESFDLLYTPGKHTIRIEWTAAAVKFYVDDELVWTATTHVPSVPLRPYFNSWQATPDPNIYEYILINPSYHEVDQFKVRGKYWSQLKAPLFTHLQVEFLVQEVIPTD